MAEAPTQVRTESNGPLVIGIAIGFLVVNVIFTSLRFYTRGVIIKALGKDDWAILAATVLAVTYSIAMLFEAKYGMGRHVENVTQVEMLEQTKSLMVGIYLYNMGMNAVKLGFLLQYKRIFQSRLMQTLCFWFIVYVSIWIVVQAFLLGFMCFPMSAIVPSMATHCLDTLTIWYLSGVMSMATDIAIFCLPLRSVWNLQLPFKQKVMVTGIFCLGFCVCIISIYRLFTLYAGVFSQDPTWDNIGAAIWSNVELSVSIIASTLPTLRPLLSRILPGGLGLSTDDRRDRSAYLRYGDQSQSGQYKANLNKPGTDGRGTRAESIDTEELALREMGPEGSSIANASSDNTNSFAPDKEQDVGRIRMTTKITVRSGTQ